MRIIEQPFTRELLYTLLNNMEAVSDVRSKRSSVVDEVINVIGAPSMDDGYSYLTENQNLYNLCKLVISEIREKTAAEQSTLECEDIKLILKLPRSEMVKEINERFLAFDLNSWRRQNLGRYGQNYM